MDQETLTEETLAAREAGDEQRLNELARMEKMNNLDEAEPQYAEGSDAPSTDGQSELQSRADRALGMAVDQGLRDSLRSVADAEDPERVLREEIAYNEDRNPDRAQALRQLAEGDE